MQCKRFSKKNGHLIEGLFTKGREEHFSFHDFCNAANPRSPQFMTTKPSITPLSLLVYCNPSRQRNELSQRDRRDLFISSHRNKKTRGWFRSLKLPRNRTFICRIIFPLNAEFASFRFLINYRPLLYAFLLCFNAVKRKFCFLIFTRNNPQIRILPPLFLLRD